MLLTRQCYLFPVIDAETRKLKKSSEITILTEQTTHANRTRIQGSQKQNDAVISILRVPYLALCKNETYHLLIPDCQKSVI